MGSGEAGGVLGVPLIIPEFLAFSSHGGHHLFINRIPPRLPKEECEHLILEQLRLHPFVLQVSKCSVIPQNSLKNKGYGFITLNGSPSQADLKSIASSLNNKLQVGCRTLGVRVCTDCHNALLEEDSTTCSSSQDSSPPNELGGSDLTESDASAIDAQLLEPSAEPGIATARDPEGPPGAPCRAAAAPRPLLLQPTTFELPSQSGSGAGQGAGPAARRRKGARQHDHASVAELARPPHGSHEPARGRQGRARSAGAGLPSEGSAPKQVPGSVRNGSSAASGLERRPVKHAKPDADGAATESGLVERIDGVVPPPPPPPQPEQPDHEVNDIDAGAAASTRLDCQNKARRAAFPTGCHGGQQQQQPAQQAAAQRQAASADSAAPVSHAGRGQVGTTQPSALHAASAQATPSPAASPAPQPQPQPLPAPPPPPPPQLSGAHPRGARTPLHMTQAAAAGLHVRSARASASSGSHCAGHPTAPAQAAHAAAEPAPRPAAPSLHAVASGAPSLHRSSAPPALRYQQHPKHHHGVIGGFGSHAPHGNMGGNARRPPPLAEDAPDAAFGSPRQELQAAWSGRRSNGGAADADDRLGAGLPGGRGSSHLSSASAPHLHPQAQQGRYYQHQHLPQSHRHQQAHHSAGSAAQAFAQSPVQAHALFQSPQHQHLGPAHQHNEPYRHERAHMQPHQQLPLGARARQHIPHHQQQHQQRQIAQVAPGMPIASQVQMQQQQQLQMMVQAAMPQQPTAATLAHLQLWLGSSGPGAGCSAEAQRGESPLPLVASEPPGLGSWCVDSQELELDGLGQRGGCLLDTVPAAPVSAAAFASSALPGQLRFARGSSDGLLLDLGPASAPNPDLDPSDELDPLALEPMIMQLLENDEDDDYHPPARYGSLTQPQRGSMDWSSQQARERMHQHLHAFGSVPVRSQVPELVTGPSSFHGAMGLGGGGMAAWFASRSKSATGSAAAEPGCSAPARGVAAAVAAAWGHPPPEAPAPPVAVTLTAAAAARPGNGGGAGGASGRGLARESCGTLRVARGGRGAAAGFRGLRNARGGGGGCFDVGRLATSSLPNANLFAVMQRRDM